MAERIYALLILIIVFAGGVGCMTQLNVNELALAHMEQKYGVPFEYVAPWGNNLSGTRSFIVSSETLPGQEILVQIENYRQQDMVILDNYLAVKFRDETVAFLQNIALSVFEEANVFYEVFMKGLSPDLTADATLNDFLADTRVPLVIMVEVNEYSFSSKDDAKKLAETIAASEAHFLLTIVVVSSDVFGTHTRDTLGQQVIFENFVYCASIRHRGDGIEIEWLSRKE